MKCIKFHSRIFIQLITGCILALTFMLFNACNPDKTSIDLNEITVADIHSAYSSGTYTAEELTEAYIRRIENFNPTLNAITVINPQAIQDARDLDRQFRETGVLLPLHGIPVIVKDNINTRGLLTTGGSKALAEFVPDEDAFIIRKLRKAGAIILAKSNMAEWAFSPMHSESTTFGTTCNPYDTTRVPAGSSGGTAAAVAANLGALGLGTDTGNSIRGPSSHCSLVGFRTTMGLTSRSGIIPLYLRNDIVGPMCRTVEDATRLLQAIYGEDPEDEITSYGSVHAQQNYLESLKANGLSGKRIGVLRILSEDNPDADIHNLFENAIKDLQINGATIIDPVSIPEFDSLRKDQWCNMFRTDVENYLRQFVKNDTIETIEDIIRIGTVSEFTRQRLQNSVSGQGTNNGNERPCADAFTDPRRIAFRMAIENVMDSLKLDAIIYPSWNHPAARLSEFMEGYKGDNSQIISPHTGQPAFTVPMGFTSEGLPAGLQILGRMFSESTLIEISYGYEQATKHRKTPNL